MHKTNPERTYMSNWKPLKECANHIEQLIAQRMAHRKDERTQICDECPFSLRDITWTGFRQEFDCCGVRHETPSSDSGDVLKSDAVAKRACKVETLDQTGFIAYTDGVVSQHDYLRQASISCSQRRDQLERGVLASRARVEPSEHRT
jgi:hypothetical protein